MLSQKALLPQAIELHTSHGGQTTQFCGQASAENFLHPIVSKS
jgi:hypothetical protein